MSSMIRKSMPIAADHISPLANGRTDQAYENLKVRVLYYPDEQLFKRMVYKATMATRGSDITDDEFIDPTVVDEAFKGGLNQCLEWANVVFEISGVSRGVTHEIVRTRKASYAQQSMRHTDMGNAAVRMPEEISQHPDPAVRAVWRTAMQATRAAYSTLTDDFDIPFQDARTVLPIATETYIIAAYPVSEFMATFSYRACAMFYPEIVVLFKLMREELIKVCPWLAPYLLISCEKTAASRAVNPATGQEEQFEHRCQYMGWEKVEGHCSLAWAKEYNRTWKSSKFEG